MRIRMHKTSPSKDISMRGKIPVNPRPIEEILTMELIFEAPSDQI